MRNYIFLLLSCCSLWSKAQISIMLNPVQGMDLKASDIFRAAIQNAGSTSDNVYLTGSIINASTGAVMVSAKTGAFELGVGMTTLNEAALSPQYDINSQLVSQTGKFPYGNFRICLHVILVSGKEDAAEACQETEVNPLSPPLLLSPENQSSITEQYPMLIWLPPMPMGAEKITYDLKLVEILSNQTPYDAIQRNFSMLEAFDITGTNLQYPANAIRLEDGKKYAWRIVAKSSNRIIGETEVWWFEFSKEAEGSPLIDSFPIFRSYVIPNTTQGNALVNVSDSIKIFIENYSQHLMLNFSIVNSKNEVAAKNNLKYIKEGSGHFVIPLMEASLVNKELYTLILLMPDNTKAIIPFRYIK